MGGNRASPSAAGAGCDKKGQHKEIDPMKP
jgi:hypothetical protein